MGTRFNCNAKKKEGNIRVDKLRAILLMEADFNQLSKLFFGYCMIKQLEENKRIPDEAYGSRVSLNTILVVVNRRLVIIFLNKKADVVQHQVLTWHNAMTGLYIHYLFYYVKRKLQL